MKLPQASELGKAWRLPSAVARSPSPTCNTWRTLRQAAGCALCAFHSVPRQGQGWCRLVVHEAIVAASSKLHTLIALPAATPHKVWP